MQDDTARSRCCAMPSFEVPTLPTSPMAFWESILRAEGPPTASSTPETYGGGCLGPFLSSTDNFFRVTDRGGTLTKEFVGKQSLSHYSY
jgi:hypothetical protein